jgi:3-mercaptopyruvate sulfurtransferase SseA
LHNASLVLLDLRSAERYQQGHVPGAINDPEGYALWSDLGPRPGAKGPGRKSPGAAAIARRQTVVLIHAGRSADDLAVAARAYLLLYDAGAKPGRLAVLRGGHEAWRNTRRPLEAGPIRRARPTPKKRAAPRRAPREPAASRGVVLWDAGSLAALRKQAGTALVDARPRAQRPTRRAEDKKRQRTRWKRFDVAAQLAPPLGLTAPWSPTHHRALDALQADTAKQRVVLFSPQGRWASLLWFVWKARVAREDATLKVYFGVPPKR